MRKKKEYTQEELIKMAKIVLEEPYWIQGLSTDEYYERAHDDAEGTSTGIISVIISHGDIFVTTDDRKRNLLRFRIDSGGGESLRVRNALMILALAIKLDNEEHPQA